MTDDVVDSVTVTSFLAKVRQVTDWYMLGVYLELPPYELDNIRYLFHSYGVERCKVALFGLWTRTKPKCTWKELSGALGKCGNVSLSVKILEQHAVVGVECDSKVDTDSEKPQNTDDCVILELQKTQVKTFCKLEREFAGIATDLESVLEEKQVPLKTLRRFLEERLDQKGAYQKATTVDELLLMVSPHYSFFNTRLLEDIIEMFIGQPLKQRLEDFEEGLKKFTQTTKMNILTMIKAQHPAANITTLPKVVLKLNERWLNVTIQRFQELVQHIFGERSRSLSHIRVEDGCICVTWCTCASAIPFLVSAAEQKVVFMMYVGVLRLSIGSTTVFEQKSSQLGDNSLSEDLMRAISEGCVEATDFLVGLDPNYRETNDHTLLTAACISGSLSTVKVLLEAKADPNLPDSQGYTPLMLACSRGLETIVALLLHWGADPNIQTSSGTTALLSADYNDNHMSLFNSLLIAGASVDAQDNAGWSSLMFACSRGCVEIVRLLLHHNANVDLCTLSGATALMFGCMLCTSLRLKVLEEDMSNSIDNLAMEKSLNTPAKLAHKSCVDMCLHLLDCYADPNGKNQNGRTALMIAAGCQHAELVQHLLLVYGADPNIADTFGWNALMYSCAIKDTAIPDHSIPVLLLSAGANSNHKNARKSTALALAAYHEYEYAVTCLLNSGADVNSGDIYGNTALHFSAQAGNVAITELLLTAGANISVINKKGETPLDMAIASCNQAVTQRLLASMETNQLLAPETTPYRQPESRSISEQIHEAVLHPLEPTGTTKLEEKHKKPTDTEDMN